MLYLWLLLLVVAISLVVFLYITSLFFQGYIYTEPSPQLFWQAPAGGAVVAAFLAWWCVTVAQAPEPRPIPYDTIFRFSPDVDMTKEPVKVLWAVKKNDEKVKYARHRIDQRRYEYKDTSSVQRPWNGAGVKAIELEHDGEKHRFEATPGIEGAYPQFISDKGWSLKVFESGPTGIPSIFRTSRFLANVFFNGMHLILWFVCLWLIMRFQWSHALGLAFCLWLLFTLAILPMLLEYAATVAQARPAATVSWFLSDPRGPLSCV